MGLKHRVRCGSLQLVEGCLFLTLQQTSPSRRVQRVAPSLFRRIRTGPNPDVSGTRAHRTGIFRRGDTCVAHQKGHGMPCPYSLKICWIPACAGMTSHIIPLNKIYLGARLTSRFHRDLGRITIGFLCGQCKSTLILTFSQREKG